MAKGGFKVGNQSWEQRGALPVVEEVAVEEGAAPIAPPPDFNIASPCPSVNEFILLNWTQLVKVGIEQWILQELADDREGFLSSTFAARFNSRFDISWPRWSPLQRFFQSLYSQTQDAVPVLSDAELASLVQSCTAMRPAPRMARLGAIRRESGYFGDLHHREVHEGVQRQTIDGMEADTATYADAQIQMKQTPPEVLRCERTIEACFAEGHCILEQALKKDISLCIGSGGCFGSDDTERLGEEKNT
ncbi:hypothetical protein B484DRAFT_481542 [Ochromonadaceae sp. CCMP2298]|nr:hypothetical protein B484DRAFT_481542 [Ochromonadaceae sp. CCMP2298]